MLQNGLISKISNYPKNHRRRFCPEIGRNCIAPKCIYWESTEHEKDVIDIKIQPQNREFKKTWDGLIGGDKVLVRRVIKGGYKLQEIFDFDPHGTLIARWFKNKKYKKGYCIIKLSKLQKTR